MTKWLKNAYFTEAEELTKFVNGKLNIEVQQICPYSGNGWILFYWTW